MSILDSFKLNGKVALVTGVSRGLGQAMAIGLAEAGADIIGVSRVSSTDETAQAIEAVGQSYDYISADLSTLDAKGCQALIQQAIDVHSKLNILVNNAGIIRRSPALEFSEQDWDAVLQVNLKALFFIAQATANHMQSIGGKIINIASLLSYEGGITVPAYTASKHGVMGVTRALANEWAQYGINVNAIAPGYMATDNTAPLRADAERNASIVSRIPAGDWGHPDALKGAVVFLASDASAYVHGTTLDVDGGWLAR